MQHTVFFHIKSIYTYQKKYINLLMAVGILGGAVLLCASIQKNCSAVKYRQIPLIFITH